MEQTGSSFAPDNISHPLYIIPTTVPHHEEAMTPGGDWFNADEKHVFGKLV